jgi:hypothetical protein
VPAIILADATDSSGETVLDSSCASNEVDYLRVDGDVSIHQALVTMKQYGEGKLTKVAESLLELENQ